VALFDRAIVRLLPAVPRPVVERLSSRYIAGPELADATRVVQELNARGKLATIDVLGEEVTTADQARAIVVAYEDVFEEIDRCGLGATVSVKLTALGLKLGQDLCRANLEHVVGHAAERDNFVRIDMEDASTTDAALELYRGLRAAGHRNVGIVLQASLRRTLADVRDLAELRPNVRLTKGIYVESPTIQFHDFDAVRASFVKALDGLLEARCYVGVATHDDWLVEQGKRLVAEHGIGFDRHEFQLLLGVRPELGDRLVAEGHRLRIYVPFGREWYAYSMRRLQENPRVAGYIAADTVNRLLPGSRGNGVR
jgi:proline dehydrogenase